MNSSLRSTCDTLKNINPTWASRETLPETKITSSCTPGERAKPEPTIFKPQEYNPQIGQGNGNLDEVVRRRRELGGRRGLVASY